VFILQGKDASKPTGNWSLKDISNSRSEWGGGAALRENRMRMYAAAMHLVRVHMSVNGDSLKLFLL
jgi:hypothetical protein